jgi:hypothetical protein
MNGLAPPAPLASSPPPWAVDRRGRRAGTLRVIVVAVASVALVVGIGVISDSTQSRPDRVADGSSTRLVFDVTTRSGRGADEATLALWAVCSRTVSNEAVDGPTPVAAGQSVTLEPALGEHGQRRLVGCIEDATIDRVLGRVVESTSTGD